MSKEIIIYTKDIVMPDKAANINATTTIATGSGLVIAGYTIPLNTVAIVFGMVMTLATFVMTVYYKNKMYKLAKAEIEYKHERRHDDRELGE